MEGAAEAEEEIVSGLAVSGEGRGEGEGGGPGHGLVVARTPGMVVLYALVGEWTAGGRSGCGGGLRRWSACLLALISCSASAWSFADSKKVRTVGEKRRRRREDTNRNSHDLDLAREQYTYMIVSTRASPT